MGVGQWTSLLMTHKFMTTPSKVGCALPTVHPNALGETCKGEGILGYSLRH